MNHIHVIIQEIESSGVVLPTGNYMDIYSYLEEAREYFESIEQLKKLKNPCGFSYVTKEGYGTWE